MHQNIQICAHLTCLPLFVTDFLCLNSWAVFAFYEWKSVGLQFAYLLKVNHISNKQQQYFVSFSNTWGGYWIYLYTANINWRIMDLRGVPPSGLAAKWNPQLRKPGRGLQTVVGPSQSKLLISWQGWEPSSQTWTAVAVMKHLVSNKHRICESVWHQSNFHFIHSSQQDLSFLLVCDLSFLHFSPWNSPAPHRSKESKTRCEKAASTAASA